MRRDRLLRSTRRRATGLLVAVTAVFAVSTALVHDHPSLAWVQATAVASMVGALADWFAVTALFRRPLGLPIPHTAIVIERKDRFAETLGSFVQESFLTPDAVTARLRAAGAVGRAAAWLSDEGHAEELAARAAEGLAAAADLLQDADVQEVFDSLVRQRLDQVALAPLVGRALQRLTHDGRHEPVLDAAFEGLSRYLHLNGADLHRRLGVQSPWWLPGPLSSRMVQRLIDRSETLLADMARDRHHPLREQLGSALEKLAIQLQTDQWMRRRGEELKAEFLAQPTVRDLAATIWVDIKRELKEQAAEPDSELRRRIARGIGQTGQRLATDKSLADAAQRSIEAAIRIFLHNFESELVGLVSGTIARWDAVETSRRLELLLGPDLQYIRINGTVVGAIAGLALHAVALAA
jgi:uncharacterized membrane-anchored protein YjiN (DUF445 family)